MEVKSFEYDFGYTQAALVEMESYLLSDEVFWPITGSPPEGSPDYPRLTLGSLLLSQTRLMAYSLTPTQAALRERVIAEIERIRSKWRVRWEKKAGRSFSVRLRMWRDYLEEYTASPQDNGNRYAYEVRLRVMLELLRLEGGGQAEKIKMLSGLDKSLKSMLEMNGFIWECEVQSGFNREVYWYLYGKLPGKNAGS